MITVSNGCPHPYKCTLWGAKRCELDDFYSSHIADEIDSVVEDIDYCSSTEYPFPAPVVEC